MKLKTKLFVALSACALVGGAVAGVSAGRMNVIETRADGTYAGSIAINVATNWSSAACNVAVYIGNSDFSQNGWSSYEPVAKDQTVVTVEYSGLTFEPAKLTLVRYNSTFTESAWTSNRWGEGEDLKWNEVSGLAFNDYFVITNWGEAQFGPYVASSESGWGKKANLLNYKINGSGHPEFYNEEVTFVANEKFKIVYGEWYGAYSSSSFVSGFSGGGESDIVCGNPGTYALYFDSTSNSTYITEPIAAAADEWAQTFLGVTDKTDTCEYTLSNWTDSASSYADLNASVKALFIAEAHVDHEASTSSYLQKAVQRYDYVLERFGTGSYSDFMGRVSAGRVTPKGVYLVNSQNGFTSNAPLYVGFVSIFAVAGIVTFAVIKRRKSE